jgi:NAD(P)-dependent dehydrogenase (short-subunit alcohol dehydrogenase family)
MAIHDLSGSTAIVTGASKGFGRGVAGALAHAGVQVIGVSRDRALLEAVQAELGETFTPVVADAADPVVAGELIDAYQPRTLVLNAGVRPLARPIHQHTWETFSRNWHVDAQHVFNWTREALLRPLPPGSTVIAFSSGAAVAGSPLSGGYAGAKAAIRFIASYAAAESERAELGIKFAAVLPQLTPATELGAAAVAAYATRQGLDLATAVERFGPALTPEQVGKASVDLAGDATLADTAYMLTTAGLATVS